MTLSPYHDKAHWLASTYANRPDIVQGAGGNISVKMGDETMLIKASGREFGDITPDGKGLVSVQYKQLRAYMLDDSALTAPEAAHTAAVRASTDPNVTIDRPSMEVWFHTLLPNYVLHTHSVYVNILACAFGGSEILSTLMRERGTTYITLPYYNPGFALGRALSDTFSSQASTSTPSIIFLENHGIITSGASANECIELHTMVEDSIKTALGIHTAEFDMQELTESEAADFASLALFPDQVIYPDHPAIRAAHRFILRHMRASGLQARSLAQADAATVANMDAEKHRKNLSRLI